MSKLKNHGNYQLEIQQGYSEYTKYTNLSFHSQNGVFWRLFEIFNAGYETGYHRPPVMTCDDPIFGFARITGCTLIVSEE
eukprot:8978417-Ditylum_brightwellii.AAC.1